VPGAAQEPGSQDAIRRAQRGQCGGEFEDAISAELIGTAVGAAVGGLIGGVVNRLFGRRAPEVEGRSITGTITGADFTGSTVADIVERGGVFRSDRRSQQTEAIRSV
jgi:uncharacterized protein YcfJ